MKKLTFNPWRHFLLALALPAVAICAGLQSCSEDDGPGLPADKETDSAQSRRNPLMRSPEEAIDIAQRAWEDFYGDGEAPASRSSRGVIDYGRPVEVVRGAGSRGGSSDTLLYVVNFADDGGFAVIAAPRGADELLAVTSQGHYYPESQPDQEKVPGFELWMENAREYASVFSIPGDTVRIKPPVFERDTTGIGIHNPINPPGGDNPPVVLDSTKIINPDNPNPGRLQQKEWNDTTCKYIVNHQLPGTWGQGYGDFYGGFYLNNLDSAPEAYYFWNGYCGCVTVAIAQICAYYKQPAQVGLMRSGLIQMYSLDWEKIVRHMAYPANGENVEKGWCSNEDTHEAHTMIAILCKSIADMADADVHIGGTGITKEKALYSLKSLVSKNISHNWIEYTSYEYPVRGQLFLMRGSSAKGGHEWVCDGTRYVEYYHYFATRPNSNCQWEIKSKEPGYSLMVHYNWGWYGDCNGWFNQTVVFVNGNAFNNLEYVKIF